MEYPFVDIHTHTRKGEGIEVVSVMAGQGAALPEPPFSIGIHPWQAGEVDFEAVLREVDVAPASAMGEIGLDFAGQGDRELQKRVLAAGLRIAEERRLPVILHCVRVFGPAMEILAEYRLPAVIFHGFIGSREQAAQAVEAGYHLSFGERSFASPKTVGALETVPFENLFLESDESPLPIGEIYARAAELLDVPVAELAKRIYDNFTNIFGLMPGGCY